MGRMKTFNSTDCRSTDGVYLTELGSESEATGLLVDSWDYCH